MSRTDALLRKLRGRSPPSKRVALRHSFGMFPRLPKRVEYLGKPHLRVVMPVSIGMGCLLVLL